MTTYDYKANGTARRHSSVSSAVRLAVLACGLPMLATGQLALAQAQNDEAELEEVVVTGSRIARDTFTTTAPVTVLESYAPRIKPNSSTQEAFGQILPS